MAGVFAVLLRLIIAAFFGIVVPGYTAFSAERDPTGEKTVTEILERNKRNVVAFYDLMFNQSRPREAIEKYLGDVYVQHNPGLADGKEAFIAYFEKMAQEYPAKRVHFKRALAEGSYVVLHCHHEFPGYKTPHWAGIDIFRLDDRGKIVEHWDVLQAIPENAANTNSMF